MFVERPGRKPLRVVWELLPGQLYISGTLKKFDERQVARAIGSRADDAPDAAAVDVVLNVGQHDWKLLEILRRWMDFKVTESRYAAYQHYCIPDSATRVPVELLHPVVARATSEIAQGRRVLSMCYGGRNRSGLLAALIMMRVTECSGQEAYDRIRAIKPNTFYNELYGRYVRELPAGGA